MQLETPAPADTRCAEQALAALGELLLLIDREAGTLQWCSPGAAALLAPLAVGASARALAERLTGLAPLLAAPQAEGEWRVQIDGRGYDLSAAPLPGGLLALRLADAAAREQAMQRHLEDRERLLFTSRVVSVGEMASTLAHELNQPIGAVTNLLRGVRMRLAREAPAPSAEVLQALERANEQAMYASRVIARIRDYTQSRQPRREPFDLAATARASAQLLDWEMQRDTVALRLELPSPLPVCGDEVMLQQVFVNLMRNALDAMRSLPADAPRVLTVQGRRQGTQAEVAVIDTGSGLSDDAEAKLFVPFASTKPSGMGIGLNICRSFIELHQGRLWFSRRETGGCAFHVALPLANERGA
jgi:two-component system sensor histidine kinase DctS